MLWGHHHIGDTKKRVWTCRVDPQLLFLILQLKIYLSTIGTTDPVFLRNLHSLDVIYVIEIIDKFICILRNL